MPGIPPERTDIAVIGAGIVGLAVARELHHRHPDLGVALFEREASVGRHQTSHNSGVIHRGMYYPPGSLKASLCVRGAALMIDYCAAHEIPTQMAGKLIVATTPAELTRLEDLEKRARANGVDVRLIDAVAMRKVEPCVQGLGALHSPGTAIVDFGAVARSLAAELAANGVAILLDRAVTRVEAGGGTVVLRHSGGTTVATLGVFCAGAWADSLAPPTDVRIVPFRGRYLHLKRTRSGVVRGLVYPVPDSRLPFLGAHFIRHSDGSVSIGPTALPALTRDVVHGVSPRSSRDMASVLAWPGLYRMAWHWRTDAVRQIHHAISRRAIVADAARLIPITAADVERGSSGIRAQAVHRSGRLVDDFVITDSANAIHVRNAPSPAATASLAIAEYIADRADQKLRA